MEILAFVKSVESSCRTAGKAETMSLHAGRWIDVVVGAHWSFLPMASIFSIHRKQSHHDSEGLKV